MTMQEYQPAQSAFETAVPPDAISSIQLSGGRTIPFRYYLGSNSTCPLVRLESPTTSKELTWGDVVELPPGVSVSVRNISYMPGDIQIQGGPVSVPPPRRISIPINYNTYSTSTDAAGNPQITLRPLFPCDTRRARRAFFNWGLPEVWTAVTINLQVSGFTQQHSGLPNAGKTPAYFDRYLFDSVFPTVIPLGTNLEGGAMRLVDYAQVDIQIAVARGPAIPVGVLLPVKPDQLFYTVEY